MIQKGLRFTNAQRIYEKYPESFEFPADKIERVKPGDMVKLSLHGERFWVQVVKTTGSRFVGRVNNRLLNPKLKYNDLVRFRSYHIYEVK